MASYFHKGWEVERFIITIILQNLFLFFSHNSIIRFRRGIYDFETFVSRLSTVNEQLDNRVFPLVLCTVISDNRSL